MQYVIDVAAGFRLFFDYVSFVKCKPYKRVSGGLPATTSLTDHMVSHQYLTKCTRILSTVCIPVPLWTGLEEVQWIDELHRTRCRVIFTINCADFCRHLFHSHWNSANIFPSFYNFNISLNNMLWCKKSSRDFN